MIDYEDLILQRQEMLEIWEDEPEYEPEEWYTYQDDQEYNARHGKE